jgi:2-iminobutanoate/2-iminopropanoate deaminase
MPKTVPSLPGIQPGHGTYSQIVEANGFVFLSGQVGDDPATGEVATGGIGPETRAMFANVRSRLQAVGLDLSDVVRATVYLVDMTDWPAYNAVFGELFAVDPPTRATVAVAGLVEPYRIEVEITAAR